MEPALQRGRLKRLLFSSIFVFAVLAMEKSMGASPKIHRIDAAKVLAFKTSCTKRILITQIQTITQGQLIDYLDANGTARLNPMKVLVNDSYEANMTLCYSTCSVHLSTLTIQFGGEDASIMGSTSSTCRTAFLNSIPININQQIVCNKNLIPRSVTVNGKFMYDGCRNEGWLDFALPPVNNVREAVYYRIYLRGMKGKH